MKSLLLFASVCVHIALSSQTKTDIVKSIILNADHIQDGVKGINITVHYNFHFLDSIYPNDSVLKNVTFASKFKVHIEAFENNKNILAAMGHKSVATEKGNFHISSSTILMPSDINEDRTITIFIPYASLKLSPQKHTIKVKAWISGKDGLNKSHKSTARTQELEFTKPTTKIFEVSLDSLIADYFDTKGQAWDHSLFDSDAPDLDFSIYLSNVSVGNIYKGNSYFISFPQKPRVFRFVISENDDILLLLQDRDDVFDDEMATWKFTSRNMNSGTVYEQKQAKKNLRSFSFRCKVE